MTLLLAIANKQFSILIADRRITKNGELIDDEHNKLCILFCNDAKLAVAFTGLATFGEFDTATWLAEMLFEIGQTQCEITSLLEELRVRANEKFSSIKTRDSRLTIIFSGYAYWSDSPELIVYVLSNFAHDQSDLQNFTLRTISAEKSVIVEFAGMTKAISAQTIEYLRSLAQKSIPSQSILRSAVKKMQCAAKDAHSLKLIGEQYNSAVINAAPDAIVTSTYHTDKNADRAYLTNVVIKGAIISLGIEIFSSSILAGPDIRKKSPCWCGSGNSFKSCHMRKFGSVYAHCEAFKEPLPFCFRHIVETPLPSGKGFCVVSSFA
jgi:hypothetical protein